MNDLGEPELPDTDELDRRILHCLIVDGRAPYARIGEVLGVSEQTVARRFARLRRDGVVQVVVGRNSGAVGGADWFVRLRCRPDGLEAVTTALARRSDTAWVAVASGGAEVACSVRPSFDAAFEAGDHTPALLDRLPRSGAILSMQAALILRRFEAEAGEWTAFSPGLPPGAVDTLIAGRARRVTDATTAPREDLLRADDGPLLDLLAEDGRATHRALAAATGWSESRVARRLAELLGSGAAEVDVDVSVDALGYRTFAYLWVTVPPALVERTGRAMVDLPQVAFAAALTGTAPLVAAVVCRTPDELYRVVTAGVGGLEGVTAVEVAPIARRVKQSGSVVERGRLVIAGHP